jgi:hypothetical protein
MEVRMRKKSKSASASKSKRSRAANLFGPAPILYGEDEAAYKQMIARVSDALGPKDFIEELWVHDLVDAAWNINRLRRIQAAFLADKVWEEVNEEASAIAHADPKLMEGTEEEKKEMKKFQDPDSKLSWDELTEKYPRAHKKFQKFWDAAEPTVDKDLIQARIIFSELNSIEQIDHLIAIAQHRVDAIIREFDRHRLVQNQFESFKNVIETEFRTVKPTTAPKITATKAA